MTVKITHTADKPSQWSIICTTDIYEVQIDYKPEGFIWIHHKLSSDSLILRYQTICNGLEVSSFQYVPNKNNIKERYLTCMWFCIERGVEFHNYGDVWEDRWHCWFCLEGTPDLCLGVSWNEIWLLGPKDVSFVWVRSVRGQLFMAKISWMMAVGE